VGLTGSKALLADIALGSMPAVTGFLLIPVELYLPNQGELNYNSIVLTPYVILWVVWVLGLVLGLRLVHGRWRQRIVHGLFWFGMFLFFSDIVAPVQLGPLDGTQLRPAEPLDLTFREGLLAGLIGLAAAKVPARHVRSFGIWFVVLLTIFQPLRFLVGSAAATASNIQMKTYPQPRVVASRPNVYHLTFDAYHSLLFTEAAEKIGGFAEFDGFVFYKDNRSNYIWTGLSVASYMTGTFYESGRLWEWLRRPYETGIAEEFSEQQFVVWNYTHSRDYVHRRASHVRTNVGLMAERSLASLVSSFADLWLVRIVPNFLQDEVYHDGKGAFSRFYEAITRHPRTEPPAAVAEQEARAYYSVALARRLIEEERSRPPRGQYVYAHIYVPHPKYIMDEQCGYAPGRADLRSQTRCATRLMVDFIAELKRLGRYQESMIVIQSDHTWDLKTEIPARDRGSAERLRDNLWRVDPAVIDSLTRALLLVKPPGRASVPLEISARAAQLVDIPATIYEAVGMVPRTQPPHGRSLLSADFPADREVHVFVGYRQTDEHGRFLFLGRDFDAGELNHFSYQESGGWKRYANRLVKW
jgi:hypothetical protein